LMSTVGIAVRRRGMLLACLLLTACRLSDREFNVLHAWLICDECSNGERAAVAALRSKGISRLNAELVGPSPGRDSIMRRTISQGYNLARVPGPDRRQQYVDFRHSNYVATYQKRAAVSLGDIGRPQKWIWFWNGWRAKRALDQAIADSASRHYRSDVVRVIKFVRASFDAPLFRGSFQPNPVSFGETISLVAPPAGPFDPGAPFDGDERAELDETIFPQNQIPVVFSSDTLKTYAVASVGPHILRVSNVGATTNTELVPVLVGSLVDPNDKALMACADNDKQCVRTRSPPIVLGPGSPAFIAFLSLTRAAPKPDSLDFFKITAPATLTPLNVTAELEWTGNSNLDLVWRTCSNFDLVSAGGATNTKPEHASVQIPPTQCFILEISMRPNAPQPAFARLKVTSP
jgi:hypothetical protein